MSEEDAAYETLLSPLERVARFGGGSGLPVLVRFPRDDIEVVSSALCLLLVLDSSTFAFLVSSFAGLASSLLARLFLLDLGISSSLSVSEPPFRLEGGEGIDAND